MRKNTILAAIIAGALSLNSCMNLGSGSSTGTTGGNTDLITAGAAILENLLGGLLSNAITEQSFVGTWTYQEPQVRFESESLLTKAGGTVMAQSIEKSLDKYLSKVGITKGATTYTFNQDKTFTISTKGRTISSGTYAYDRNTKTLSLNGTLGIMNQTCTVGMDGTNLCLLYDADKLLSVLNGVGQLLGKTGALGTVASVFGGSYDGMKVGFSLKK
jgi:hypothetical protein